MMPIVIRIRRRIERGMRTVAGLAVVTMLAGSAGVAAQDATPMATPTVPDACATEEPAAERITVGYAGLSGEFPFVQDVNNGLQRVADCLNVELIITDNEYDPQVALTNADTLVTRGVDVAIEFQTDVGALVLLELPQSGEMPQQRMSGAALGVQEILPELTDDKIIRVDGKGNLEDSRTVFQDVLTRLSDADHILVSAINDPSAVGALRAAEAANRTDDVMIAGQNATIEARTEICRDNPAFIGSVPYFPDRYGDNLIPLAIRPAGGEAPPEEVLIDHLWIDRANIEEYYPGGC